MLNLNGRADQDFWSLAADEWPNPQLDFSNHYRDINLGGIEVQI